MYALIQLLRKIGLSEKEAQTYISSLKIGPNPASTIAKHAKLSRSTTYCLLETLMNKNLVSRFEKNNISYFIALDPTELLNFINEKRRDLNYYKDEIRAVMPTFDRIKNNRDFQQTVKSYSDQKSVKELFQKTFPSKSLLIYCIKSESHDQFFLKILVKYLNTQNNIKLIINGDEDINKFYINTVEQVEKLPSCIPAEVIGEKRMILSTSSHNQGIEIINPEILNLFKSNFLSLWKQLSTKKDPS